MPLEVSLALCLIIYWVKQSIHRERERERGRGREGEREREKERHA